jgi:ABC-type microcin C transport system permease subunit YejE
MIQKVLFFPVWIVSSIIKLVVKVVGLILSFIFGTVRLVISRLFGTFFGALIGFFLGQKHIGVKLFKKKKKVKKQE